MLEYFETVWASGPKAGAPELAALREGLRAQGFPVCEPPPAYLALIQESNGGDFTRGRREYQFFSMEEALEAYQAYRFPVHLPHGFPFALDGMGNFYLFNLRERDERVYAVPSGDLAWESCVPIAQSLLECLEQDAPLDELMC